MICFIIGITIWFSLGYIGFILYKGYFVYQFPTLAQEEIDKFYNDLIYNILVGLAAFIASILTCRKCSDGKIHFIFTKKQIKTFISNQ